MDYTKFIRKLEFPADYLAPIKLSYDNLEAHAISRAHLGDDVGGINQSIEMPLSRDPRTDEVR